MPPTKASSEVDAPAEVAQNAIRTGTVMDLSASYDVSIGIAWALTSETAHTGTRVIVEVSYSTSGDEDWFRLLDFELGAGTANQELTDDSPLASSSTTIAVTLTAGYEADGVLPIFIEDVDTFADSEWASLVSHVSNTSVTIQRGTTNAHAVSSTLSNIAGTKTVPIQYAVQRACVTYDNTFDSDGSTIATRTMLTKVTAN